MCVDWRVKAASKLGVSVDRVEDRLRELAGKRVFVHFKGETPRVEGVDIIRVFKDMGVASAICSYEGLRKLLSLDSVTGVEPVPEASLHGAAGSLGKAGVKGD